MLSNNSEVKENKEPKAQQEMDKEMSKETQNIDEEKTKNPNKNDWKKYFYEINLPKNKYLPQSVHMGYLLLSFTLAFFLWFAVTDKEEVESVYSVKLEYSALPEDLLIVEDVQEYVQVRLKSTAKSFAQLKGENLSFTIDLSEIEKGANAIEIELDDLFPRRFFEVLSISPTRLVIVTEKITEKDVKIETFLSEDVKNPKKIVGTLQVDPLQVRIKGAESEINKINKISLPFTPDTDIAAGKYSESLALVLPKHVEAVPPLVRVNYEIKSGLVTVNYIVPITVVSNNKEAKYKVSEEKVTLNVLMPDHLIRNEEFINALSAYIVPTGAESETLLLRFKIPPTAKLKSSSIDRVEVNKIQ